MTKKKEKYGKMAKNIKNCQKGKCAEENVHVDIKLAPNISMNAVVNEILLDASLKDINMCNEAPA
jgi:uncharacterized lipoprotein YajG